MANSVGKESVTACPQNNPKEFCLRCQCLVPPIKWWSLCHSPVVSTGSVTAQTNRMARKWCAKTSKPGINKAWPFWAAIYEAQCSSQERGQQRGPGGWDATGRSTLAADIRPSHSSVRDRKCMRHPRESSHGPSSEIQSFLVISRNKKWCCSRRLHFGWLVTEQ